MGNHLTGIRMIFLQSQSTRCENQLVPSERLRAFLAKHPEAHLP